MFRRKKPKFDASQFDGIIDGCKSIYAEKIRPLEEQYLINNFHYPLLNAKDFDAKPLVLLVGQYSTGKTSFIKYLLDMEFPGMHIGPEPTTDGFQAIMYGGESRALPGHALVSNPETPFYELSQFGNSFLQRFSGCEVPSNFSRGATLVDTPGVLAGKKQEERSYNFLEVVRWFAPRADMIMLMFDANKVDVSDEFKKVIVLLQVGNSRAILVRNSAQFSHALPPAAGVRGQDPRRGTPRNSGATLAQFCALLSSPLHPLADEQGRLDGPRRAAQGELGAHVGALAHPALARAAADLHGLVLGPAAQADLPLRALREGERLAARRPAHGAAQQYGGEGERPGDARADGEGAGAHLRRVT